MAGLDEQFDLDDVTPEEEAAVSAGKRDTYSGSSTIVKENYLPDVKTADVSEKQNEAEKRYTREDMQRQQVALGEDAQNIYDARNNPANMKRQYANWNSNLAKDNPAGNLNNRSYSTTLGMQRLVDAMNNRLHYVGGNIGADTRKYGSSGSIGRAERWEPLETEETRQMAANRQIEVPARLRQMQRAENVQDYPLELQKAIDQAQLGLTEYQQRTGVDFNRKIQDIFFDKEYAKSWDTKWSAFLSYYTQAVPYNLNTQFFNAMQKIGNYIDKQGYAMSIKPGMSIANPIVKSLWDWISSNYSSDPNVMVAASMMLGGMGVSGVGNLFNTYAFPWRK